MTANNSYVQAAELASYTSTALATLGACPAWDSAMSAYLTALTLCDADARYGDYAKASDAEAEVRADLMGRFGEGYRTAPAAQEELQGINQRIDAATSAWSARYCDRQEAAALALAMTPAPTLAAAIFKHKLIVREDMHQAAALPGDCMDVLAADFAKLADNPANAAWQAAREAEQATREAAQRFYDENVKPANEAHEAGTASVADVTAQEDAYAAFSDEHLTATKAMMATPAPSVSAAIHKLRVGLRDWFFDGSDQGCRALEHIASDLARLTGEA